MRNEKMISIGDLLYVVGTSWTGDPARLPEYHAWYNDEHVPSLLSMPGVLRGDRYTKLEGDKNSSPFLATYIYSDEDGWNKFKASPLRRYLKYSGEQKFPEGGFEAAYHIMYKKVSSFMKEWMNNAAAEGVITLSGLNFSNPAREAEFNIWNNNIYIPQLLHAPQLMSVDRLIAFEGWGARSDTTPKYIIVSEFASEQAYREFCGSEIKQKADDKLMAAWPIGKPGFEIIWNAAFKRMRTWYKEQGS
jgi:hypothetical protein